MRRFFLALALLHPGLSAAAPGPIAARVNGKPVYESEIEAQRLRDREKGIAGTREEVLDRLILFRLSVEEAERRRLSHDPEVRRELDTVLYRRLLDSLLVEGKVRLTPTEKELKALYEKSPLIRLRHLVLMARTPEEAAGAKARAETIRSQVRSGTDFRELVLKHSQDLGVAAHGGDLDFRGRHNLDPVFYDAALGLEKGRITGPIEKDGGVHLLQLTDRKPFEEAFAPYLEHLRTRYREEKERAHVTRVLASLREKAKIEYLTAGATP